MRLTAILAVDQVGAIGLRGRLPWPRLARDMQRFRAATMGKVCLVGRKTYETLPPLVGRTLAVLTRPCRNFPRGDVACSAGSFASALYWARTEAKAEEVVVIGGAEVYRAAWPQLDRLLLTVVHGRFEADTYLDLPEVLTEGWQMLSSETYDPDEHNPHRVTFSEWVRP